MGQGRDPSPVTSTATATATAGERVGSAVLRHIAELAERDARAADRALLLLRDGALVGEAGARLADELHRRAGAVRRAFLEAFDQVAATVPGPPPAHPALGPPPGAWEGFTTGPGSGLTRGFVGGDPERMRALEQQLASAGRTWEDTGTTLARLLTRAGTDPVTRPGDRPGRQRKDTVTIPPTSPTSAGSTPVIRSGTPSTTSRTAPHSPT
ncbi:hypothetical protein HTZ77_09415 [Nonomuraea sp. SMC257]|uniref:Uncharacterized protein n=1 Tax=Nonomuraea montanisoli TaxID=2741721 RepID=A0A7Y6I737_9ACTN|nr:hypothetical protein [Nonomuraea montanisoli]NUW31644.1 hypothetical protein [Nonomuraea montanisoli]